MCCYENIRLYSADVSRRHRWIRGDWQLLRWLLPEVPGPDGRRQKNPLSLLSRWKLFDNLRRSFVPSALTLLLLLGWTVLSSPWFWTLSVLGIIFIPTLISSVRDLLKKPDDLHFGQHLTSVGRSFAGRFVKVVFTLACLPYEAFFSLDAILRTAWRMLARKRLLEWSPSGNADRSSRNNQEGLAAYCRTMWIAPLIATAAVLCLALSRPAALAVAGPVLGLCLPPLLSCGGSAGRSPAAEQG